MIERADLVHQALHKYKTSAKSDFTDCLIETCAHGAGCRYTVTFDPQAAKTVGMKLLD